MISIRQFNTTKCITDVTNLFRTSKSAKNLNKLVNRDMKHLNNWSSANKISPNVEKTELVFFLNLQGQYFLMKQKLNLVEKGYIHETDSYTGMIK